MNNSKEKWSDRPEETWGEEVPLGTGSVDFREYLLTLDAIGYTGPLTIEREIPQDPDGQKSEIVEAVALLNRLRNAIAATSTQKGSPA